jgi:hypothetical protein
MDLHSICFIGVGGTDYAVPVISSERVGSFIDETARSGKVVEIWTSGTSHA